MDRVRLGRVLGKGARLAARTALEAVDAATAAAPSVGKGQQPGATQQASSASSAGRRAAFPVPPLSIPTRFLPAARAASSGVVSPLKQASRALWHELTGSFFALFALSFGVGVWHMRGALHSRVPGDRNRLAAFCVLALLFLYFSISSFARARRRKTA